MEPQVLLLAHQGGWDEILFVVAPLVVFAGLLAVARRRVDRMDAADPERTRGGTPDPRSGHGTDTTP